jgi:hypothetical protein
MDAAPNPAPSGSGSDELVVSAHAVPSRMGPGSEPAPPAAQPGNRAVLSDGGVARWCQVSATVDSTLSSAEFTLCEGSLAVSVRLDGLDGTRSAEWLGLLTAETPTTLACGPAARIEADGEGILTFVLADTSFGGAQIAVAAPVADCRAAIEHVAEHAVPLLVDASGVVTADAAAEAAGRQAPVRFAALAWTEDAPPA